MWAAQNILISYVWSVDENLCITAQFSLVNKFTHVHKIYIAVRKD
jgi:hypothetical protein